MNHNAYVIFRLDDQFYAISVNAVQQIIRSVKLTYLNNAPKLLLGIINMSGEIIPVIHIRKQLRLPAKEMLISDRILIAKTSVFTIAFIADEIIGVMKLAIENFEQSDDIYPGLKNCITGISKFNNLTILIYDIDTLFPPSQIENISKDINSFKELS